MAKAEEKIKVMIISSDTDERLLIKNLLQSGEIVLAGYAGLDDTALAKIKSIYPNIVILTLTNGDGNEVFSLSREIYQQIPGCGVLLLTSQSGLDLYNRAIEGGVRRVLDFGCTASVLIESIHQVSESEKKRLPGLAKTMGHKSRVLTFFAGKGGTGKTTLAVNTAVSLVQKGRRVILIDIDLQFGDVNLFLNIDTKDTIAEMVQESGEFTIDKIKAFTVLHSSGLHVIAAPKSPEYAEYVTPAHIEGIINNLRPYYEYIILDLTPSFNDVTLAAIENSDRVFLVTGLDITGLRNVKICVNILESLQQKDKLSLIINKEHPSMISVKDYQNIVALPIVCRIREDAKLMTESLNRGIPLVLAYPRVPATKEIKLFCDKIDAE